MSEFKPFPKMPRLSRECIVTEKIDGTNAQILIVPIPTVCDGQGVSLDGSLGVFDGNVVFAGSRTRWIQPGKQTDNYGFATWVTQNIKELLRLGPGQHFGEWWGCGIQRNYDLSERRFSLFNASRWAAAPLGGGVIDNVDPLKPSLGPACCHVVPTLYRGPFATVMVQSSLEELAQDGSKAAPGFKNPEGVIVYHTAAGIGFKKTYDDGPKGTQ